MTTIHLISHTHWDREWYLTFQQFRLKLVQVVDELLDIFASDPHYLHYMLDGQTLVLDDYLAIRPERGEELRMLVQGGRLLIGPWHVLPDEFLVSPEATIRNLLQGERTARRFGGKMRVGYVPDPFGHIGQLPQILAGFDIQYACVQRGLSDEPCEFWWEAPDGTRVLMAYLRDTYANAADLPVSNPEVFYTEICRLRDSLLPHSATNHVLLMHGNDHRPPQPATSSAIAYANQRFETEEGDCIVHSTLPEYFKAIQPLGDIPTLRGELRSSKRHHLLPAVLSTRMWIKQRNRACETLLEKWAEPFNAFANGAAHNPTPILRYAWRMLMECHPHDSICGCSIDQVHDEMRPRFDQVEQIGEELTRQSLESLAAQVQTLRTQDIGCEPDGLPAIVVFNPNGITTTGIVDLDLEAPGSFKIVDDSGNELRQIVLGQSMHTVAEFVLNSQGLLDLLGGVDQGKVAGLGGAPMALQSVDMERAADGLHTLVRLSNTAKPKDDVISRAAPEMFAYLTDPNLQKFFLKAVTTSTQVRFVAPDVPPHGYRTFWLRAGDSTPTPLELETTPQEPTTAESLAIANEWFTVEASSKDGTLTLTDKRSGTVYKGLNRFIDGGDFGDEYNYCPPKEDKLVTTKVRFLRHETSPVEETLIAELYIPAPEGLSPDRQRRSDTTTVLHIKTTARLANGVPRMEIHTEIDNLARDHRLRVHFPAPFAATQADFDGHFEIVRRPIELPAYDSSWTEEPRPEKPQRAFVAIDDGDHGLLVANRGLPEAEVLINETGQAEIALTLLRCVGWLSRGDLSNRKGDAGPQLPTPGAQMIGRWAFDYAVIPYAAPDALEAYHQAWAFNTPLRGAATGQHAGTLPATYRFIEITPTSFILSAVKEAEDGQGWIVRGYNVTSQPIQVKLKIWRTFEHIFQVNLAEEVMRELKPSDDGAVRIEAQGHQIVTLRFA
jgi:alpha-mannosidase